MVGQLVRPFVGEGLEGREVACPRRVGVGLDDRAAFERAQANRSLERKTRFFGIEDLKRHQDASPGRERGEAIQSFVREIEKIGNKDDDGAAPRLAGDRFECRVERARLEERSPPASTDSSAPTMRSKASRPAVAGSARVALPPNQSSPTDRRSPRRRATTLQR